MGITSTVGLSSGINFDDLIGKLLAVERRPIGILEQRKTSFEKTIAAFSALRITLSDLRAKATALSSLANFNDKAVTWTKASSGADLLTATADRTAAPGTTAVTVLQLAQAHAVAAQGFVDQNTTPIASGSGTFTFKVGQAGKTTSVEVTASTTLTQLRDLINAAGGDATASIINDGSGSNPYRLVLTSKNSGAANTITISSNPTTLDFTNKKVEAAYAAPTNSFAGTVSSNAGNNYTGSTNKTFLVKIVSGGAAGTATYTYSTDGGITWLGANGTTYTGSNAITTQGSLTNYIDGAASSNSANEGVQIAFGSGTLAANDTFSVDVFNPTLQSAQDAVIRVGNLTLSRTSNTVADAIQGVTLSLIKASSTETVDVTVSAQTGAIKTMVKDFVSAYNEVMKNLNDQLSFDPKIGTAKPLLGESTALNLKRQLQTLVTSQVPGASPVVNGLGKLGVSSNKSNGQLSLDEGQLEAMLSSRRQDVARLLVGLGVASHSAIEYVGKTSATQPGTYAVEILSPPAKAAVTGGTAVPSGGIAQSETLTVSLYTNATNPSDSPLSTTVSLPAGSTISAIVNAINSALAAKGIAASASNTGGKVTITASRYGANYKLVVFSNRADDGNQSGIGTTPLTSTGADVAGRINGHKATGLGETLTSASGFAESGLTVKAAVATAGSYGTVTVSSGIADRMVSLLDAAIGAKGTIQTRTDGLSKSLADLDADIARQTKRLATIESQYRARFERLETLLAQFQTQSQALSSALSSLDNLSRMIARR